MKTIEFTTLPALATMSLADLRAYFAVQEARRAAEKTLARIEARRGSAVLP